MIIANQVNYLAKKLNPVILETQLIKLIPLTMQHINEFSHAGNYQEIWQYMSVSNQCINRETAKTWIQQAITAMAKGSEVAFVIIDKATNKLVGTTRLFRFNQAQSTLEIGHTFITPSFQRTYVNSHAKYLLLAHVFESLGINRVEICTHQDNVKSRHAIIRIGGHFEGIIRQHRLQDSGQYRNTALFSILNNEWLRVKNNLLSSGKTVSEFCHERT
jgi:RimJ/RimL family protein N-acetyltransferase